MSRQLKEYITGAKIAAFLVACGITYVFSYFSFNGLDALIRDSLQFLNSTSHVNQDIKTVNLNIESKLIQRPLNAATIQRSIDLILQHHPKYIVLLFEPPDFLDDPLDNLRLVEYLNSKKNVFLGNSASSLSSPTFANHKIFGKVHNSFTPPVATNDTNFGAQDKRWRRTLLAFDQPGVESNLTSDIQKLGFVIKKPEDFKYPFRLWNTTQAYIKTFPVGTFGHYQYSDLIKNNDNSLLENKVVLVGAFDEFSFLSKPSVLNIFGQLSATNFKSSYYPYQDYIAQIINFWTTGDYIKYVSQINDLAIVFVFLITLIFLPISTTKKLIVFVSAIPVVIIFTILIYVLGSFYIDLTRSIALLIFVQYFTIPIVALWLFNTYEKKKELAVNNARIDALIEISEKIAHDIRSPLSTINLLIKKIHPNESEYSLLIDSSIRRIEQIAESLLQQNRFQSQAESGNDHIDLKQVLKEIVKEKVVLSPQIDFNMQFEDKSVFYIRGNNTSLERMISNIIDNSIFALRNIQSPQIKISLNKSEKMQIDLEIADNGLGIPVNILKIIGKKRITTKSSNEGNGIGILHSKRLIDRMGGQFNVVSSENTGTTIRISLVSAQ